MSVETQCLVSLQMVLLLWFAAIGGLSAQSLTLDSCKTLALQNNAEVKNAALDVEAAREVKRQAFTKYFPQVSAMAGGYYALKPLIEFGIDGIENASARQWLHDLYFEYGSSLGLPNSISLCENGLSVGGLLTQPVYMGGQIANGNRLATVGVEAAELQSRLAADNLLRQVEETYWMTVSLYEKRKTLQQALAFLDTLHRDVTAAADAGLVTKNDILKVSLKQDEMRSNILKVNNGILLSSMLLCQTIGIEYSDNLTLTDTVFAESELMTPSDTSVSEAVGRRIESQLLGLQVSAAKLRKKMVVGESLPHLLVGGTVSYGNLIFDNYGSNALAFATLQFPLTGWWETSHKIRQQNLLIQKAENDREDLMQKMELETRRAWSEVEEAQSQMELAASSVRNAEANLQDARTNFSAGLIPVSELLEAQTLHMQARNRRTDALIDLHVKSYRYAQLVK